MHYFITAFLSQNMEHLQSGRTSVFCADLKLEFGEEAIEDLSVAL